MYKAFTPGPWIVVGNDDERADDGKFLICNARTKEERPDQWGIATIWNQSGGNINGLEDKANATLIAAAPDLYYALHQLVAAYESVGGPLSVDPAIAKARSALVKAVKS
jgi:hypothetical protein